MKFAIISAGEGSRLAQEGVAKPKPLVELNGEAMIERLVRIFLRQGARQVVVIINDRVPETREFLTRLQETLPIEIVVKSTPSSMHSFYEISHLLEGGKFCLTTVDTIFREEEFGRYIEAFRSSEADGLMAVTDYVDDEKPLYISTDDSLHITGFHDRPTPDSHYISGGIYCLTPRALETLHRCVEQGQSRMRNFQRQLVADGLRLEAWPFKKIIDVDHAEDIGKAEAFLRQTIVAVSREVRYSPNHIGNDALIYNKVIEELRGRGHTVYPCTEEEFRQKPLPDAPVTVVTMARDERTLSRLMEWEEYGATLVNTPRGVRNCVRQPLTEILVQHGVPHPESWIVRTDGPIPEEVSYPCWLKRGDSHALVREDVCYAASQEEAADIADAMKSRGIPTVVISRHLPGDIVKFYGVQGDDFFHWFYPSETSHSKFGLEAVNGQPQGIPFDSCLLKQYADKAAEVLGVPIYGGDAIVAADGRIRVIDFNDWPSFAPCREEAAKAIARRIMKSR